MKGTDGGVLLAQDGHKEVADVALRLEKYCVDEPVKCPLIFGGKRLAKCYQIVLASAYASDYR